MPIKKVISKKQLFLITCVAGALSEDTVIARDDEVIDLSKYIDIAALVYFVAHNHDSATAEYLADDAVRQIKDIWKKYDGWPDKWRYD